LTDRNRHVIPFFDIQCTSLLAVYWVLVVNQMLGVGTPTFTVAGSALRYKANLHNCYELRHLLSRANAICFKQATGTLRVTTMCTVPITGSSRLFGCTYNCTTVYEFSFQKKIRVCQDKYWCSCLLNEWMCSSRRYSHPTPIHGQSLEIPN